MARRARPERPGRPATRLWLASLPGVATQTGPIRLSVQIRPPLPDAAASDATASDATAAGYGAPGGSGYGDATASGDESTDDDALTGAVIEDVVVVESVHTGDQGTADYGAPGSGISASGLNGAPADGSVPGTAAGGGLTGSDLAGEQAASADTGLAGVAASGTVPGAGDSAAEWSEIKALFVDDPGASVQRASTLVERAVEGFMSSLRQRQDSLGSWQEGDATGTEELRKALRGYRGLFDQLEQMSGQFPTRTASPAADGGPAASEPAVGAPAAAGGI